MADDLWADFDAQTAVVDDPWADFDPPEEQAKVMWGGRPVSASAIQEVAAENEVSPHTIMRLGTVPGRIESVLTRSEAGSLALRVTEGIAGIGETVAAAGARAVGRPDISARIHEGRRQRQEFLEFIEKGGAVEEALGERGARIFNQTAQSLGEIGVTAAAAGPVGVYSYTTGSAWENGLDEGQRAGMYGGELIGHAGRQAVIEGGITFLMGRAAAKFGGRSLEESFSPAARHAVRKFFQTPGMKEKLKIAGRELGGWAAEGAEEMLISGGQQVNELASGMRGEFDWAEMFEAGASGVLGRGAVGAMRGLESELRDFEKRLPEITSGIHAAEVDLERGINPFEVKEYDDARLAEETGRESMTGIEAASYREALDFYLDEMRREGETGALERIERDARQLREEERQRDARVRESKEKAQRTKGHRGESVVQTEPVTVKEQAIQKADERATFKLKEFEERIRGEQQPSEALHPTQPPINPYILAPWESDTRAQRSIRVRNRKIAEQRDVIKQLRKALVDNKRLTKEQQNQALELVKDNVARVDQWKFSRNVLDATRPSLINKLLDRIQDYTDRREHNLAVGMLRESLKKATNLRQEFAEAVKGVRQTVDLKKFKHREVAESLKKWADENPQAILSDQQRGLVDRLEKQNVSDMTADDLIALADYVEQLAYQSALADRLIGEEASVALDGVTNDIVQQAAQSPRREMQSQSIINKLRGEADELTQERTLASKLFHEIAERPEVTLESVSPALATELYHKTRQARRQFQLRRAATAQLMEDAFNQVGLEHSNSVVRSLAYRVGLPSTPLEQWRSKKRKIGGVKMSRGQAWWAALTSLDPDGWRNLNEAGMKVGKQDVPPVTPMMLKEIFDFIGPEGEATVRTAFEHLNTYVIDGVNDTNKKLTGRILTDKTNAVPLFKSDEEYARLVSQGRMHEGVVDSYGHLKHREGGVAPIAIPEDIDGIDMFMTHADRMHRYAAYGPQARNAEVLLNHEPVKQTIKTNLGDFGYEQMVDAIRGEAVGFGSTDDVTRGISAMNHTVAGAVIGARVSVMMAQGLDTIVASAYEDGGITDLLTGMSREFASRSPAATMREMKQVLGTASGEWHARYEGDHYAGEVTNGIFRKRSYFRPSSLVDHAADSLMVSEQLQAAVPNYLAAKEQARRQFGLNADDYNAYMDNPEWVEAVVDAWERKIVRGSNSSHGMELSSGLRYAKKNPLAGLVMNFYNTAGKVYSLFSMAQLKFDAGDKKGAARFAAAGAASTVLFSALQTAMTQSDKEKEDLNFAQRVAARSAKNLAGLHPAGGQIIADNIVGPSLGMPAYGDNPVLLAEMGVEAVQGAVKLGSLLLQDAEESEDPEEFTKAWIKFGRSAGPIAGVPTPGAIDIWQRAKKGTILPGLSPAEKTEKPPRVY